MVVLYLSTIGGPMKRILRSKKRLLLFFFIILSLPAAALDLRFVQEEGDAYRIVAEVNEGVWADDELIGQSEILNRIGINILKVDEDEASLEVSYGISEKSLDTDLYIYSHEETTSFTRTSTGLYGGIHPDEYLPSVRNIPTFPENAVSVGDSWSEEAEEVHDLGPFFGVDYRLHIPFRVFYTYEGPDEYEGRPVEVLRISYHFLYEIALSGLPADRLPSPGTDLPVGLAGDFNQRYLWDPAAGIPAAVEDEFSIRYAMASGHSYTFKGNSTGKVIEADQWNREDVRDEIEEAANEMDDVSVSLSDEGIVLTLDDIHFVPDSAKFLPGEEKVLLGLKDILLKFSEHDLLITGHTARVRGGSADQGQQLSEDRAAAVAAFFLQEGVRESSRMVVQGKGSREPVGDNDSEEGRRKNRRVEITILDN